MSHFLPSADRGAGFRRAMDASLLESVCLTLEEVRPGTQLIPAAEGGTWPDATALDYGAYFDLALPASSESTRTASLVDDAVDYLIARISGSCPVDRSEKSVAVRAM